MTVASKPVQKPKRGRKMQMTTKDNDAMCTTIEESTTILSENSQSPLNENWHKQQYDQSSRKSLNLSKKPLDNKNNKKRAPRKTGANLSRQESKGEKSGNKNSQTTSASDEDEECSANNCARPQGNYFPLSK